MTRKNDSDTERDTRGRFAAGNAGKPKGARNRTTKAVAELLEGEAQALTRKAIELALSGDTIAMRLCLERIAPPRKDAPVSFGLPSMKTAASAAKAAGAVLEAVSTGQLTPLEAVQIMGLIETYRRTLETSEFEARIVALEAAA